MSASQKDDGAEGRKRARERMVEAQTTYVNQPDYVTKLVRDATIVDAVRAGVRAEEIAQLVPDLRSKRSFARREDVPDGLLSPAEALRASGLGPADFLQAVRSGRLKAVVLHDEVRAFRLEEIERLRTAVGG